jgi:hypothetical protein
MFTSALARPAAAPDEPPVVFAAEGAPKQGLFDRLADRVTGEGRLTAAEYSLSRFRIGAEYCAACKKMIVDTEVQG